jgi:hypothetical protein
MPYYFANKIKKPIVLASFLAFCTHYRFLHYYDKFKENLTTSVSGKKTGHIPFIRPD